jgi:LacI family transcriptional regulator
MIFTMNAADSELNKEHKYIEADLRELANDILDSEPRPTAVVAANDLTAHVLRLVARERGLSVPDDLSIIGYDGQHRIPNVIGFEPVSTMVVNNRELARAAVDLAHELIVDPLRPARNIEITAEYEDMGTVAEVPKQGDIRVDVV